MSIKRDKVVYSEEHGKLGSNDEITKKLATSHDGISEAINYHKSLGREAKAKTSLENLKESALAIDKSTAFMKTLSDTKVYKANPIKDKPLPVAIFEKMLKQVNHNFFIHRNMHPGAKMNGQGHEIYFLRNGLYPEFVTGVGEACELIINPETKFHKILTGKEKGKEIILHKGWLATLDKVISWSKEKGISGRTKLKEIIK